jgi:hypothetical protein
MCGPRERPSRCTHVLLVRVWRHFYSLFVSDFDAVLFHHLVIVSYVYYPVPRPLCVIPTLLEQYINQALAIDHTTTRFDRHATASSSLAQRSLDDRRRREK